MNVSLDNVSRGIPPPFAAGVDGSVSVAGSSAPKNPKGDWAACETGAAELAKIAGEETVDEAALRRDDELGKLISKAFERATAAAVLPPLGLVVGDISR